jgi:hypothetical protein
MLFHASILAFAIFFLGLLELFVALPGGLLVFAMVFLGVLFWMSWRFGGSASSAIVPTLFSLSTIILLFFISLPRERHLFIFLSTLVFYLAILGIYRLRQYAGDVTAQSMLSLVAMTTLFFLFSAFYGIFLNFQRFTELALMLSFGISAFLTGLSIFSRSFRSELRKAWFYSLILGFFAAQVAWIGSFWPFSYLTAGVLTLMFISPLWDMIQSEMFGGFSKGRLAIHILLILALTALVLSSSEWLQVV